MAEGNQPRIDEAIYRLWTDKYNELYSSLTPLMVVIRPNNQQEQVELDWMINQLIDIFDSDEVPMILSKEYKPGNIHFHGYFLWNISKETFRARFKKVLPTFRLRVKMRHIQEPLKAIMYTIKDGVFTTNSFNTEISEWCSKYAYSKEQTLDRLKRELERQFVCHLITKEQFCEKYCELITTFEMRNVYSHHVEAYLLGAVLYVDNQARRDWTTKITNRVLNQVTFVDYS